MGTELPRRVTGTLALALAPLSAAAAWLAGPPALLGILAGAGLAWGSFGWVTVGSRRVLASRQGTRVGPLWILGLGLRHLSLFAGLGALLWSGHVHPVALVVGLSLLPPVLIVEALRAGTREP